MSEITKEEYEALKAELDEAKDKAQKIEANRNEILSEFKDYKKTAAEKAEQERLELEQRAIDEAKAKGDLEKQLELEKQQSERLVSELKSTLSMKNEKEIEAANKVAINDVVSKFAKNDGAMKRLASTLVDHSHDENGNVVSSYKDLNGDVVANSFEDWYQWAQSDEDMKNYLAGSKSSGLDPTNFKPAVANKTSSATANYLHTVKG